MSVIAVFLNVLVVTFQIMMRQCPVKIESWSQKLCATFLFCPQKNIGLLKFDFLRPVTVIFLSEAYSMSNHYQLILQDVVLEEANENGVISNKCAIGNQVTICFRTVEATLA